MGELKVNKDEKCETILSTSELKISSETVEKVLKAYFGYFQT
jgi:hypothetical protein